MSPISQGCCLVARSDLPWEALGALPSAGRFPCLLTGVGVNRIQRRLCVLLAVHVTLLSGCVASPAETIVSSPPAATSSSTPQPTMSRPGPDNTGVPAGLKLRPSGDLRITAANTIVDGLDINGCVVVLASNVVIRNTRIRCAAPETANIVQVETGATRLVIEDTEIDGLGQADIGVGWNDYTLRRVEIHGTNDGVRLGPNVVVEDSWIHSMARKGDLHPDAVQATTGRNIIVRNNTLDVYNADLGDLNNAAVQLGTETGQRILRDALFEENYFNGGNYTVNIRGDANLDNVIFRANVYGPNSRYGPVQAPRSVDFSSDVFESDGSTVKVNLTR